MNENEKKFRRNLIGTAVFALLMMTLILMHIVIGRQSQNYQGYDGVEFEEQPVEYVDEYDLVGYDEFGPRIVANGLFVRLLEHPVETEPGHTELVDDRDWRMISPEYPAVHMYPNLDGGGVAKVQILTNDRIPIDNVEVSGCTSWSYDTDKECFVIIATALSNVSIKIKDYGTIWVHF